MSRSTSRFLSTVPTLSAYGAITHYSRPFQDLSAKVRTIKSWAPPGSLAATAGISVDFFS